MKLLFVSPPFGEKGQKSKGLPIARPDLEYMAGLTRQVAPDVEIALLDANKETLVPEEVTADVVAFTVLTPQAPWAYRTADRLRALGKKVLLGGIHVTALPEEAKRHADAILVGEAETVWAKLLDDLRRGAPEAVYHGHFPELEGLPRPVTDLWGTKYVYGYFQTSRGCPHRCTFCSVHEFFGGRSRMRPVDEVVAEVAASRRRLFWGIDDNIWGVNVTRSIELYAAMAGSVRGKWGSAPAISSRSTTGGRTSCSTTRGAPASPRSSSAGSRTTCGPSRSTRRCRSRGARAAIRSGGEREDLIVDLRARLFTLPRILSRVAQVGWRGVPMSHITSWMIQFPQGRAFKQYARERRLLAAASARAAAPRAKEVA